MITDDLDVAALLALWDERWPGCSKLPYRIRAVQDRWVRFHALPGSKRYPGTETEYATVLGRHNTVLSELVTGSSVLVMTAGYSGTPQPQEPCRSPDTVAAHPGATYWASARIDSELEPGSWVHLYTGHRPWSTGCLDPLLRAVADDTIANVLVAAPDLSWLYHPYDGGMDVLLPSTQERDSLRHRHHDWLSTHPRGL